MTCIAVTNQKTDTIMQSASAGLQKGDLEGRAYTVIDISYNQKKNFDAGCVEGAGCIRACIMVSFLFAVFLATLLVAVIVELLPAMIILGGALFIGGAICCAARNS